MPHPTNRKPTTRKQKRAASMRAAAEKRGQTRTPGAMCAYKANRMGPQCVPVVIDGHTYIMPRPEH